MCQGYLRHVSVPDQSASGDKARRREASELVASYHQQELRGLLERVREGFAELDAGVRDEFELDELIHRYKRAAADLWRFCVTTGARAVQAADMIEHWRERGEPIDWWAQSAPRRDRARGGGADAAEP